MNNKLQAVGRKLIRRLPGIMTASGVALNGIALVSGIRATGKAVRVLDAKEEELERELENEEKLKEVWKLYIPTAGEFLLGNALIIGGAAMRNKENAMLMTACSIADMTLKEYKNRAIELFGEEKAEELENEVMKKKLIEAKKRQGEKIDIEDINPEETSLIEPGKLMPDASEPIWFYVEYSGHIIRTTRMEIERAVSECNKHLYSQNFVSINDFFWELGMKEVRMGSMGEAFGWRADKGIIDVRYSLYEISGVPCYVVRFINDPENLYY